MARTGMLVLALGFAVQAAAHAQGASGGRTAATITPVAGLALGYERGVAFRRTGTSAPELRTSHPVGQKAVAGVNVEVALGERFGVAVGVLHRGAILPESPCGEGPPGSVCAVQWAEPALLIARAAATFAPLTGLPLYLSAGPLYVHQRRLGMDEGGHHWGVGVGVAARMPLGSTRFALDAGVDEHTIFWRALDRHLTTIDWTPSYLWVVRAGIAVRL